MYVLMEKGSIALSASFIIMLSFVQWHWADSCLNRCVDIVYENRKGK